MKNNKGITLTILTITVVILAILAFSVIGMISGENGMFHKAKAIIQDFNNEANNQTYVVTSVATGNYIPIKPTKAFTYYIKFNPNGGSGEMDDLTMTYGTGVNLNMNAFTKTGAMFAGWNTEEDGSGTWYTDGNFVNNLTNAEGDIINLYAQWKNVVKYAVQIYGINQDVDENYNILGLTFGPAIGDDYNNKYVTHEYEETSRGSGIYYVKKITHDVSGETELISEEYLTIMNGGKEVKQTRNQEEVNARREINLHNMTWEQIANVSDKTLFIDCMLCGDTKSVILNLNDTMKSSSASTYEQKGDGAGVVKYSIVGQYLMWNPNSSQNSAATWSNGFNVGGYAVSHIRATLIGENNRTDYRYAGDVNLTPDTCLFSCIENELQNVITAKKVRYASGNSYIAYSLNDDIVDKIWLFSIKEFFGIATYSGENTEGLYPNGVGYDKFALPESMYYISEYHNDNESNRIVYFESGSKGAIKLRSCPATNKYNEYELNENGKVDSASTASSWSGLGFGFCIR